MQSFSEQLQCEAASSVHNKSALSGFIYFILLF